jgi:hypothetical protein
VRLGHRLRAFQSRGLRKIFGFHRGRVPNDCVQRTHTEGRRGAYRVSMGKPEGNRPLGRLKHRWENIKINLGRS